MPHRLVDGSSGIYDAGFDILLLCSHCFYHAPCTLASQLHIPTPVADPLCLHSHEWIDNFMSVPICGRFRWTVLETRLDALPQFQLPLLVLRFCSHRHVRRNGCHSVFLLCDFTFLIHSKFHPTNIQC